MGGGCALTAAHVLLAVLAAVVGLAVGSFLNVVIHRVPRGESVVAPRSRCPVCRSTLSPRDNVPVLSWILLRGRCRTCATPISKRYPLVECLTAVVFVLLALRFADQISVLPAFLWLGAVGIALALIDLDVRRLPDALTLPSYPVAALLLGAAALAGPGASVLVRAGIGALLLFALYFALWFGSAGRGMGLGDVKLAGLLGAYLAWVGWGTLAVGAFAAFALGGVVSIGLLFAGSAGRKTRIPFGPFMLAGALLALIVGEPLVSGYRSLTGL